MNKTLHVFVYLFLLLAGAGLFFEYQLNQKRALLVDRNRLQEEYLQRIAGTVECVEPSDKNAVAQVEKDSEPVEAKIVDTPQKENLLETYKFYLEETNLKTYDWNTDAIIQQLRAVYVLDGEGKVVMDGERPLDKGPGTERELLEKLLKSCQEQQTKLNTTRSELKDMRLRLADVVEELNALKQECRQDKVTITERDAKIAQLESEKAALENQIVKLNNQINELNADITSLKDEIADLQDKLAALTEEVEKVKKERDALKQALKAEQQKNQSAGRSGAGSAVGSLPFGDKGKIVMADNENMFAIVEFTPEAMSQLKGKEAEIMIIDLGVKRPGFSGEAGEFVGRIHLRQEVPGKNFVICDILQDWEQSKVQEGDIVYAD